MRGIVLFAHGARDPEWARPFHEICNRVRSSRPEYPIEVAFLESMSPSLEEAIDSLAAEGAAAITVFPLFMAQGGPSPGRGRALLRLRREGGLLDHDAEVAHRALRSSWGTSADARA